MCPEHRGREQTGEIKAASTVQFPEWTGVMQYGNRKNEATTAATRHLRLLAGNHICLVLLGWQYHQSGRKGRKNSEKKTLNKTAQTKQPQTKKKE